MDYLTFIEYLDIDNFNTRRHDDAFEEHVRKAKHRLLGDPSGGGHLDKIASCFVRFCNHMPLRAELWSLLLFAGLLTCTILPARAGPDAALRMMLECALVSSAVICLGFWVHSFFAWGEAFGASELRERLKDIRRSNRDAIGGKLTSMLREAWVGAQRLPAEEGPEDLLRLSSLCRMHSELAHQIPFQYQRFKISKVDHPLAEARWAIKIRMFIAASLILAALLGWPGTDQWQPGHLISLLGATAAVSLVTRLSVLVLYARKIRKLTDRLSFLFDPVLSDAGLSELKASPADREDLSWDAALATKAMSDYAAWLKKALAEIENRKLHVIPQLKKTERPYRRPV